jgi:hypothetical protein
MELWRAAMLSGMVRLSVMYPATPGSRFITSSCSPLVAVSRARQITSQIPGLLWTADHHREVAIGTGDYLRNGVDSAQTG